ncbi:MCE family protein [Hoyosella altamirensis]|uniref:Phospholipid/cholesterol/gamma-HCH transport system substrate-binding protein n=1 Tax=Hoyosella altamirensis TaxID=616997 RepID=A0A839RNN8_9ACTN|nr:MlaD family protein [Hoyosella altamirensis]MBB3037676.1 phospholipid/cholesterol/gamma-HCH transport system substrate-binding protein [Hoyosella altamirensis]
MISRFVKIQLILFVIVAVVGVIFVSAKYARLHTLLGFGEFPVYVEMEDNGGIFPYAEVTYRGVPAGLVGEVVPIPGGTRVELLIRNDAPDIPADSRAKVNNRSAAGEQFVDLQADTDEGPFLESGSVIEFENSSAPVRVESLLNGLYDLSQSIPLDKFREVVAETAEIFHGRGEDLGTIIDSFDAFSEEANESMDQTLQFLRDGSVVLRTQAEQANEVRSFSRDLTLITDQLQQSDQDIRRIINTSTDAGAAVSALLERGGPGLTEFLRTTEPIAEVLGERGQFLRPVLQALPALGAAAYTAAPGDGTARFGLIFELNNPPACTVGYEGTFQRLPAGPTGNPMINGAMSDWEWDTSIGCRTPQGSPVGVRSSNKAIFADPSVPQPWDNNPKRAGDHTDLAPFGRQAFELLELVGWN